MKKIVVITGASKGLGLALTNQFVKNDWIVLGCANSQESIDSLNERFGKPHHFERINVAELNDMLQWSKSIRENHGIPDLIINNAGVINDRLAAWDITPEVFQHNIDVNLSGTFHVAKAFVPMLIEKGTACLINMSSGWGRSVSTGLAPYCASKYAVEGFTKTLALDLPQGISTYPLDPGGGINTDMLRSCLPDEHNEYPSPEEWAPIAYEFITKGIHQYSTGDSVTVPI